MLSSSYAETEVAETFKGCLLNPLSIFVQVIEMYRRLQKVAHWHRFMASICKGEVLAMGHQQSYVWSKLPSVKQLCPGL
jgi:hypothetical protein